MSRLQLNPRIHSAWSSPTELRFGIDQAVVTLNNPPARIERLIEVLREGVPEERYPMIATAFGVAAAERTQLLSQLRPVLLEGEAAAIEIPRSARMHLAPGTGDVAWFAAQLTSAGHRLVAPERAEIVVIASQFACPPAAARTWLTRGMVHLPVVFGETSVKVGPFVGVGQNPCAFCLELARVDSDPSWPAIASQCHGRRAPTTTPALTALTTGLVTDLVDQWLQGKDPMALSRVVLTASMEVGFSISRERVNVHPKCDCQRFAV